MYLHIHNTSCVKLIDSTCAYLIFAGYSVDLLQLSVVVEDKLCRLQHLVVARNALFLSLCLLDVLLPLLHERLKGNSTNKKCSGNNHAGREGGLERWGQCFNSPSTIHAMKDVMSVREREERGREREKEKEREKKRVLPHLSEKLKEVIDVCGPHGLCYVSLVLQMVFAGVGSVHLQPVKKPDSSSMTIALKYQLQHKRQQE